MLLLLLCRCRPLLYSMAAPTAAAAPGDLLLQQPRDGGTDHGGGSQ
jgi:hypothetical protein